MSDLHSAIMNIQATPGMLADEYVSAYKMGHKDARHAAAELALATHAGAAAEPSETASDQMLGAYAVREDAIRELLNKFAPHTEGNIVVRVRAALTSAPAEPNDAGKLRAICAKWEADEAPAETPQAAGAIDAREQGTIETPFGTYPADAWDAFEKHRIAQGLVLGMPGLKARPAFMAGWDAALASRQEAPPAAGAAQAATEDEMRAAFQQYDWDVRGAKNQTPWQLWRDGASWANRQALAATPAPEARMCECGKLPHGQSCSWEYPNEPKDGAA